jgi:hypothetical protein
VSTSRYEVAPGIFVDALCCNECGHRTEHATETASPPEWLICTRCAKIEWTGKRKIERVHVSWAPVPGAIAYRFDRLPPDVAPTDEPTGEPEAARGQTRMGSAIEVAMNIVIGFSINWVANLLILPLYGFQITGSQAFSMGLIFTGIAIARGYVLRRVFNRIRSLHHE